MMRQDPAEPAIAEVRIGVAAARIELQRLAEQGIGDGVAAGRRRPLGPDQPPHGFGTDEERVEGERPVPAGGMAEKVAKGDRGAARIRHAPRRRMQLDQRRFQIEPLLSHQRQHGRGRHRLGQARDLEFFARGHRPVLRPVGEAEGGDFRLLPRHPMGDHGTEETFARECVLDDGRERISGRTSPGQPPRQDERGQEQDRHQFAAVE